MRLEKTKRPRIFKATANVRRPEKLGVENHDRRTNRTIRHRKRIEADEYLKALLEKPEYRSMNEVHMRAANYIKDEHLKNYFINKAKEYFENLRS